MRRVVFAAEGLKSELICLSILTSFIPQQTAARTKRISLHCAMVTMFSAQYFSPVSNTWKCIMLQTLRHTLHELIKIKCT